MAEKQPNIHEGIWAEDSWTRPPLVALCVLRLEFKKLLGRIRSWFPGIIAPGEYRLQGVTLSVERGLFGSVHITAQPNDLRDGSFFLDFDEYSGKLVGRGFRRNDLVTE